MFRKKLLPVGLAALIGVLMSASASLAAGPIIPTGVDVFGASLRPVPHDERADSGSNARGSVAVVRTDTTVRVTVAVTELDAGLMHMQHIHGIGLSQCPTAAADTDGDGLISLAEGLPAYGPVVVPLTEASDPTMYPVATLRPDSPIGFSKGAFVYKRIFVIGQDMPIEVANALEDYQVVVHGIDVNGNGVYDTGEDLLPAACGTLSQVSGAAAWQALVLDHYGTFPPPATLTPAPVAATPPGR